MNNAQLKREYNALKNAHDLRIHEVDEQIKTLKDEQWKMNTKFRQTTREFAEKISPYKIGQEFFFKEGFKYQITDIDYWSTGLYFWLASAVSESTTFNQEEFFKKMKKGDIQIYDKDNPKHLCLQRTNKIKDITIINKESGICLVKLSSLYVLMHLQSYMMNRFDKTAFHSIDFNNEKGKPTLRYTEQGSTKSKTEIEKFLGVYKTVEDASVEMYKRCV